MGVELPTLVFATNNQHKIDEAQAIVQGKLHLISLKEAGVEIDVEETEATFRGNALLKAQAYSLKRPTFSSLYLETAVLLPAKGVQVDRHNIHFFFDFREHAMNVE